MTPLPVDRSGARVLLLDSGGRALLLHGCDPSDPGAGSWWFTPGGGQDPGESLAQCAARELAEETGLRVAPAELGEPVFQDVAEFDFEGVRYRQQQVFFVLRTESWQVDDVGWTDLERRSVLGHRWWTAAEIAASAETIYPLELPGLIAAALGPAAKGA
jgi:8-oxo-dGTP pyrophosphatase MutT (NUDIX family)